MVGFTPSTPLRLGLFLLQVFLGATAIAGGLLLLGDPSGGYLEFSVDWLASSPLPNYLVPGVVLFAILGGGHLAAAVLTFRADRFAGEVAGLAGTLLMGFVLVQLWWVETAVIWVQPVFFGLGGLQVILGLVWLYGQFGGAQRASGRGESASW